MTESANNLSNEFFNICTWAFQWKMNFNPDPSKQTQEVVFSRTIQNANQPCLISITKLSIN